MTPADVGIVLRKQSTGNQRAPCPKCGRGDRDQALSVTIKPDGAWVAHCFRCGWNAFGGEERPVARASEISNLRHQVLTVSTSTVTGAGAGGLAPRWAALWRACVPIAGTIGERYLLNRSCALPPRETDLRFHPAAPHWPSENNGPALVALATDAESCAARTLHLTFLAADGSAKSALRPPRLLLPKHSKAGAVIRLWPNDSVERTLGVAEGIESALSLALSGVPTWAAIDAGNLARLPVLPGIEELLVAVDRDPAGEVAAQLLARRWSAAGCTVRLVMPNAGDLNDVAQGNYVDAQ